MELEVVVGEGGMEVGMVDEGETGGMGGGTKEEGEMMMEGMILVLGVLVVVLGLVSGVGDRPELG